MALEDTHLCAVGIGVNLIDAADWTLRARSPQISKDLA